MGKQPASRLLSQGPMPCSEPAPNSRGRWPGAGHHPPRAGRGRGRVHSWSLHQRSPETMSCCMEGSASLFVDPCSNLSRMQKDRGGWKDPGPSQQQVQNRMARRARLARACAPRVEGQAEKGSSSQSPVFRLPDHMTSHFILPQVTKCLLPEQGSQAWRGRGRRQTPHGHPFYHMPSFCTEFSSEGRRSANVQINLSTSLQQSHFREEKTEAQIVQETPQRHTWATRLKGYTKGE